MSCSSKNKVVRKENKGEKEQSTVVLRGLNRNSRIGYACGIKKDCFNLRGYDMVL